VSGFSEWVHRYSDYTDMTTVIHWHSHKGSLVRKSLRWWSSEHFCLPIGCRCLLW